VICQTRTCIIRIILMGSLWNIIAPWLKRVFSGFLHKLWKYSDDHLMPVCEIWSNREQTQNIRTLQRRYHDWQQSLPSGSPLPFKRTNSAFQRFGVFGLSVRFKCSLSLALTTSRPFAVYNPQQISWCRGDL